MGIIAEFSEDQRQRMRLSAGRAFKSASSLQAAAQIGTNLLRSELGDSLPLARCYMALPASALNQSYRAFADQLSRELGGVLADSTRVLCLMGSSGELPEWNRPLESKGHLAIPLLGSLTVQGIPMVARLLHDLGIDLGWLDQDDPGVVVEAIGRTAGMFYVQDARRDVDDQRRKVVPAQDFVANHGIRTVFGMGGAYLTGSFVCFILFTRESLSKDTARGFLPFISTFKSETVGQVLAGNLFRLGERS